MEKEFARQIARQTAEVVEAWIEYRSITGVPTLVGFAEWIQAGGTADATGNGVAKLQMVESAKVTLANPQAELDDEYLHQLAPAEYLAQLLGRLTRFAQLQFAQLVEPLVGLSIDEFLYLLVVAEKGTPRKTDAIRELLHEPATGSKIIHRLQQQGLLAVHNNPRDGRSQLLSLTEKGMAKMMAGLPLLSEVGHHVAGPLSQAEVMHAVQLLDRLNTHHTQLHQQKLNG